MNKRPATRRHCYDAIERKTFRNSLCHLLQTEFPGVYAVDNELYRELVHAPAPDRERAIREAERRRRSGQAYTMADYLRDRSNPES